MPNYVIKVYGKFIKADRQSHWNNIDQILTDDLQLAQIYTSKKGAQLGVTKYSKQEFSVNMGIMILKKDLHLPKEDEFEIVEVKITIA